MPTPCGVNYLLQFLLLFLSIPQLSENKNQKWTFYVFMSFCPFVYVIGYEL